MFYDYNFYEEMDSTMIYGIKRTIHFAWMFAKTLVLTIVLAAFYCIMTPVRIYDWIKEENYLEKTANRDEQIRFQLWKEEADKFM